jgi:exonuclease III
VQLSRQVPVLADWVLAREKEGVPYAIVGDFNRALHRRDDLWRALTESGSVLHVNAGLQSPCWGMSRDFIDHIVLGGRARAWLAPGSLRVLVYRETGRDARDRLSDHCPVRVTLRPAG